MGIIFNPVSARLALSRFWNSHGVTLFADKNLYSLLVCSDFYFYKIIRFFFHYKIFNFYKIFFSHLLILKMARSIKLLVFLYDVYFQGIFKNSPNFFFPTRCKRFFFQKKTRFRTIKKLLQQKLRNFRKEIDMKGGALRGRRQKKLYRQGLFHKQAKFSKQRKHKNYLFSFVRFYKFLRKAYLNMPIANLHFLLWNSRETFKTIFFFGSRHREFFPFQTLKPLTDSFGGLLVPDDLEYPEFPFKIIRALPGNHSVPSLAQLLHVFSRLFRKIFKNVKVLDIFIVNLGKQTLTARLLCEHMLRKVVFKGKPKTRRSTINKGFFNGYLVYLRRLENLVGCSIVAKGRIVRQQRSMYKWIAHYGFFSRNKRRILTTYCKGSIATKNGVLTILVYLTKFFVPKSLFLRSFLDSSDFFFSRTVFQRLFFNKSLSLLNSFFNKSNSSSFKERSIYFGREPVYFSNIFSGVLRKRLFFPLTTLKRAKKKYKSYKDFLSLDFNLRRRLKKLYKLRVKESNFRIL